jgi:outer membrane murein-binding lipoprotein Lpp
VEKIEAPTEEREEVLTQKANTVDTTEGSRPLQTLAAEPMARLADIATNAKQLASQMHQLASQIEEAAIEIELQQEQAVKDSQTLKQLQSLLKGIGATNN